MATFETRLKNAFTAVATDIKGLTTNQGSLSTLTTTAKNSLVAAMNELKAAIDAAVAASGAQINDGTKTGTSTWSSNKIDASITAAITALVNGAPGALDTLKELADQMAADQTALSSITAALGNRLRFDAAQSLTGPQQQQAYDNLGLGAKLGDPDADLVAHYTTAKA